MLKHPNEVRRSIGLSGQFAAVDEYLTGRENLQMVGQLYQMSARDAKARAGELLERFNLADAADRTAKTYSGGMRRRLDLAAALVVSPPVMFMDEPTTGLDPRNRQQLWEVIQELVAGGTTLLLTTQYLEEADHLAHDICVVDHGKVIARGTSDQLKARTGGERVEVVVHEREHIDARPRGAAPASARARPRSRSTPASSPCRSPAAPSCSPRSSANWTPAASRSTTSACAAPPSTTSSSPSPATRAEAGRGGRASEPPDAEGAQAHRKEAAK